MQQHGLFSCVAKRPCSRCKFRIKLNRTARATAWVILLPNNKGAVFLQLPEQVILSRQSRILSQKDLTITKRLYLHLRYNLCNLLHYNSFNIFLAEYIGIFILIVAFSLTVKGAVLLNGNNGTASL